MSRPAAASTPQQSANVSTDQQKVVSNSPYQHNFQPRVLSLDELMKKKGGGGAAGKQAVSSPQRKVGLRFLAVKLLYNLGCPCVRMS